MNTAASVARLCEIKDVTEEDARRIRSVWKAEGWVGLEKASGQSFTALSPRAIRECKRSIVDHTLGTYGVEFLGVHKSTGKDGYYCNAGDTYATTVIFVGGHLAVGCMGDYVDKVRAPTHRD